MISLRQALPRAPGEQLAVPATEKHRAHGTVIPREIMAARRDRFVFVVLGITDSAEAFNAAFKQLPLEAHRWSRDRSHIRPAGTEPSNFTEFSRQRIWILERCE